jgi:hypothetical protein
MNAAITSIWQAFAQSSQATNVVTVTIDYSSLQREYATRFVDFLIKRKHHNGIEIPQGLQEDDRQA